MRLLVRLLLNALALLLTAYLVPGFKVDSFFPTAVLAAIILGVINTFIRPLLVMITIPITMFTLGLFLFVINAVILWFLTLIVPGVSIDSFWTAILAAIVLAVVSTILSVISGELGGKKAK